MCKSTKRAEGASLLKLCLLTHIRLFVLLLVFCSEGLYDSDPRSNPSAQMLHQVHNIEDLKVTEDQSKYIRNQFELAGITLFVFR